MQSTYKAKVVAFFALGSLAAVASAQQPGSVEYNTVYLPAHGVGDTVRTSPRDRWGALASGDGKILGFVAGTRGEAEAEEVALDDCAANGGRNCKVVTTFVNACMAVAAKPGKVKWVSNDYGWRVLNAIKAEAMEDCGAGCEIVRQGCAEPARR